MTMTRREAIRLLGGAAALPCLPGAPLLAAPRRDDDAVREALERWQDLKLGVLIHWGIYSVWGSVESWPIEAAEHWGREKLQDRWDAAGGDLERFRAAYRDQRLAFAPRDFDPEAWADAFVDGGMRYCIFTAKHHDGFCMWDTRTTDFRTTHAECPFHALPHADAAPAVLRAARARGLAAGAYFSKPDWNHPDFWIPGRPTPDKRPNYDVRAEPERWRRFVDFTHAQLREIAAGLGDEGLDILWLDGAWVGPAPYDVDIDRIAAIARERNPACLVVDRWVPGPHENYLTPEQKVPAAPLERPWEACVSMADQWSWYPPDEYKSERTLVHLLVEVVAKGGNLLLGIGPRPDGRLPATAIQRLRALGAWLEHHREGIDATRAIVPYADGALRFTRRGRQRFAFLLLEEGEAPPARVVVRGIDPPTGPGVRVLGKDGLACRWDAGDGSFAVRLDERVAELARTQPAIGFAWEAAGA